MVLGGEIEGTKQREQNDAAEVDAKLLAAEDRQMLACSQADVLGELDVELEQSYMPSVAYTYILFWSSAIKIQALAPGILARRKVHFALLSADPDAVARVM